ncbi:MAG: manganese efflux pump MntP family protein [Clostridia bacterium]|nr:manganese efflux pump MntP family protein [Clostridia bacterium]
MLETVLLAIGLAMDASCVSMTNAMTEKNMRLIKAVLITLLFGIFQMIMPLIGYLIGSAFSKHLLTLIPLIALILLSALGLKSIIEVIVNKKKGKQIEEKKIGIGEIFIQAIATSIDALSIGVLFIADNISSALLSFGIIGIITWGLSLIAFFIGKKFGKIMKNAAPIIGGIVLILVGLKIFIPSVI